MKLLDRVELNPTITMQKGKVYPFVEMANVGMFMREPLAIESKAFSSGMKFEDGDTVVARITPCLQNGKGFFCKDIGTGFGSTEFLVFRPKDETVDNRYLYYLFQTNEIRDKMIKSMVGATGRQRVNNDVFNSIDVNFPDIDAQRRIGEALFCYDDLIENNRKQLKVLDSALHLLYKEWFEIGGSHDEPMLPSGWEKKTVKDISSILRRGISPKYDEDGTYYVINQKCIRTSIMDMNEARRQSKTYPAEINLIDSDIVICSTGTGTLGRVGQVYGNHPDTTFDSHVTMVRANKKIGKQFLYCSIKAKQDYLMSMGRGSTNQQELYRGVIEDLEIVVPPLELIAEFEKHAQPMHDKVTVLIKSIGKLIESRNHLIAKLMKGVIEI